MRILLRHVQYCDTTPVIVKMFCLRSAAVSVGTFTPGTTGATTIWTEYQWVEDVCKLEIMEKKLTKIQWRECSQCSVLWIEFQTSENANSTYCIYLTLNASELIQCQSQLFIHRNEICNDDIEWKVKWSMLCSLFHGPCVHLRQSSYVLALTGLFCTLFSGHYGIFNYILCSDIK